MLSLWILGAALLGVVGVWLLQRRTTLARHILLSHRQPARRHPAKAKVPLGHEGLEMEGVLRTQRLNQGLERSATLFGIMRSDKDAPDMINPDGQALPDDETYSARYHAAFHSKKHKDRTQ